MTNLPLMIAAGVLAGAMNAIAGGGSFVSFPAMVYAGLPTISANVSSTVALFPGTVTSSYAYRHALVDIGGHGPRVLAPISAIGGLIGAILLLVTPERLFDAVIPWLLLLATLTFAFGAQAGVALRRAIQVGPGAMLWAQLLISIYGGYFGGAVGLMMMAAWSLLTASGDLKSMAPARVLLVSAANGAAVLCFLFSGAVHWPETIAMSGASVIGGYFGAHIGQRLPRWLTRGFVLALTAAITAVFFAKSL